MKKIMHICFSESARGAMRYAISMGMLEGYKTICFIDDLSNGPINDLGNVKRRIEWCKRTFALELFEALDDITTSYSDFNKHIKSIDNEDVYIWYADNGREMCGLFYTLSLLHGRIDNVYTINVTKKVTTGFNTITEYNSAGEIPPDMLNWFASFRKKMDMEGYLVFMDSWKKVKKENTNLRIAKDNMAVSVQEDYFDETILHYTNDSFRKISRNIGKVLGRTHSDNISDTFISWRILELIKTNKITYKGNSRSIRDMEIKRSSE